VEWKKAGEIAERVLRGSLKASVQPVLNARFPPHVSNLSVEPNIYYSLTTAPKFLLSSKFKQYMKWVPHHACVSVLAE
jgi:hypothetical protein